MRTVAPYTEQANCMNKEKREGHVALFVERSCSFACHSDELLSKNAYLLPIIDLSIKNLLYG